MRVLWEQLHHLPVYTQSGDKVGVIEGVTVQADQHLVDAYEIKPSALFARFFAKSLLVSPKQVIALTAEKMIVEDTAIPAEVEMKQKQTSLASAALNPEVHPSEEQI